MNDGELHARLESSEGMNLPDDAIESIMSEYERIIPPPVKPTLHQWILCAIGLVGAGKTTIIRPVSEKLGLARVSSDELRKILRDNGYNFLRTIEVAKLLIKKYLKEGYSVAVDADAILPEHRTDLLTLEQTYHIPIIWIHMNPPESFILHKLQQLVHYDPSGIFSNADEAIANYRRRKPLHEKYLSDMQFDHVFDTSKNDLDRQIDRFVTEMHARGY